jgi:DNA-binding CsgD family transcriptional regulator
MQEATFASLAIRGRDAALGTLTDQLDRVRSGVGAVVLVEGVPGIGKSRLLAEAATLAGGMSFRVGAGAAEPGGVVELAALMAALFEGDEPLLDRPGLQAANALPEQRYWLLQDLQDVLEQAAVDGPMLVCLDDMQWADGGTAAALRVLPRRVATLPIAWVIAFRPSPRSIHLLSALAHLEDNGAERIVLGPLDEATVEQLTLEVMQAAPDEALLNFVKRVGGSPFMLTELLEGLRDEGIVRVAVGRAELLDERLPRRVRDSMRDRLQGMSKRAREAAIASASLGRKFSFSNLAAMLGQSSASLLTPVDELIGCSVLREHDDELAFRHDILRDAVRGSVSTSARRAFDRQAADLLLAGGAAPVEVAAQLAASASPGDEVAITTLLNASDTLAGSDPGAAADLSRRGLELAPSPHPLRGPLAAKTAVLLHEAGRVGEAQTFAKTSLRDALPPEQEAGVHLSIAGMFALSPDVRVNASRQALSLPDLSPAVRARHLVSLVHNLMVGGRCDEALSNLSEARAAADGSGDANAAFMLNLAESGLEVVAGRFERALELTEAACRSGSATHDHARERLAQEWRCEVMLILERVEDSVGLCAAGISAAQHDRQGWARHIFEMCRGRQLLQAGRLVDAAAVLEGELSPDQEARHEGILDGAGAVSLAHVALHLGDARLLRRAAELGQAMLRLTPPNFRHQAAWLLALQSMATGDAGAARAWLCAFGDEERTSILPLFPPDVTDEAQLVRIALATGDHELAASAADGAERRAALNPGVRTIAANAAHARGLISGNEEDLALATELFEGGARPLALASVLEDLGTLRMKRGAQPLGVEALERALALYGKAEAAADIRRVRTQLREYGVHRRAITTRERPSAGWAAMTDSELAVARLVAKGHTNREVAQQLFVSPHTVNSHLRRIFAKLDVNSRVALTGLVADYDNIRTPDANAATTASARTKRDRRA